MGTRSFVNKPNENSLLSNDIHNSRCTPSCLGCQCCQHLKSYVICGPSGGRSSFSDVPLPPSLLLFSLSLSATCNDALWEFVLVDTVMNNITKMHCETNPSR